MIQTVRHLLKDESGATAIEYGLIAALIAVALIGVLGGVSGSLDTMFGKVKSGLENAGAPAGE